MLAPTGLPSRRRKKWPDTALLVWPLRVVVLLIGTSWMLAAQVRMSELLVQRVATQGFQSTAHAVPQAGAFPVTDL
jgi:hypothetical protein